MAINSVMQLENSVGLGRVIVCSGLSFPVIIHPIVHGEPVLTAQAFYYLEQLHSVAKVRFENHEDSLAEADLEYLIDNYLFEFSKRHPDSNMTFKVMTGKFWHDDVSDHYLDVDQGLTEVLVVDARNDDCVLGIEAIDAEDRIDLYDWDIGRNYTKECLQPYVESLTKILDKKVSVQIMPSSDRDGYFGKMRVVKTDYELIDYHTALQLADLCIRNIPNTATVVDVGGYGVFIPSYTLPIERITAIQYHNAVMLSHYFSGLHELNAMKSFVGFYNVLEYYFEEAPRLLQHAALTERLQIESVLALLVTDTDIQIFLQSLPPASRKVMDCDLSTSSSVSIAAFNASAGETRKELARWLYEIRCAVIHSKKTRKGAPTATFEPYTPAAQILSHFVPTIRWLAVKCIEKDAALNPITPPGSK
ncbi:hypothetical protein BZK31_17760 [Pseudomonas floridensis]|uniref:Uncharacterized protein n=1 Tax=Pseudomonas floridensis TaxID=1958950 RepID=A0A1X0N2Y5_9PSED|nr:hypothetical protein [Pseudomonas floridensis]ORC57874.1 hypothetical protein BZK31_17760 [Pseudomonas floridensis]